MANYSTANGILWAFQGGAAWNGRYFYGGHEEIGKSDLSRKLLMKAHWQVKLIGRRLVGHCLMLSILSDPCQSSKAYIRASACSRHVCPGSFDSDGRQTITNVSVFGPVRNAVPSSLSFSTVSLRIQRDKLAHGTRNDR